VEAHICECRPRKSLPRHNLMDTIIGSTNTPIKHINKLPNKPWRFKCNVIVKKKVSKKKPTRKEKKIHFTYEELKPNQIELRTKQQSHTKKEQNIKKVNDRKQEKN
jgi:hypothetical protein